MHVSGACAQEDSEANACPPLRLHCEIKWLEVKENAPQGPMAAVCGYKIKIGILIQSPHFSARSLSKKGHWMVFPKSWRLKSTSSRIMFFVSRARKTIVEGPIPVLAKGFSCLRWVSSWFHHSFIMVSSSFNLLANSGKVEHRVFWSNDKCRQTAQGEPIGAMLALLKAAFESWTFLENYNELNI